MRRPLSRGRLRQRAAFASGSIAAVALASLAPLSGAAAAEVTDLGTASDYGATGAPSGLQAQSSPTGAWFVQTEGTATISGGSARANSQHAQAALSDAAELGLNLQVREQFSRLWPGFSAEMDEHDAALLSQSDAVQAVFPVMTIAIPPEEQSSEKPDMVSALAMTGADIVQSELGYTGNGVQVGILDTGIDYDHPDLGGQGEGTAFPTDRVSTGHDFVGDDYNSDPSSQDYQPVPHPDSDPDDCNGHGSHVAGIVGADGDPTENGVRGVSPGVTFGAYRVFGCDGSTDTDIMLDAMEMALDDGMDVLNMSVGAAFASWPQYPTAVASDHLVDSGMVVVASAGNDGEAGTWSVGAPSVGEEAIGVASYDSTEFTTTAFRTTPDGESYPYTTAGGSPEIPTSGGAALALPADGEELACEALSEDFTDEIVVISRGECAFHDKAVNAQDADAAGVVVFNNEPGLINPTVEGEEPITIPVAAVSLEAGESILAAVAAGEATDLAWTDALITVPNPTGGLISSFSSYGMTADLQFKPDVGAPGGQIWSTLPLEQGGYGSLSGTSMASPHVAGAVALLLEAHPQLRPDQVKDLLRNTADPSVWALAPDYGYLGPSFRQGAGLLDIDDAVLSEVSATPSALSLGESDDGTEAHTVTVTNSGEAEVTYDLSAEDGVATSGDPNDPEFSYAASSVDLPASVTVPAGSSASFDVTIAPNEELELAQYGGYVELTPQDGEPLRIPYAGFAGDYQELPLMTDIGNDLPVLGSLAECDRLIDVDCVMNASYDLEPDGATYSMQDGDVPTMLVHLQHPAQSLQMTVYAAQDGQRGEAFGPTSTIVDKQYLGRSGSGQDFTAYTWDGRLDNLYDGDWNGTDWRVPDGDYIVAMTAVSALGDSDNPDDVQTVYTAPITIDRNDNGNPWWETLTQMFTIPLQLWPDVLCNMTGVCAGYGT